MVLTDKQRNDLHSSILEYLKEDPQKFGSTIDAFTQDANLTNENTSKSKNLLEKKWTAVVRLQKKVMDLEAKLTAAETDLKNGIRVKPGTMKGDSRYIPRGPHKSELTGHRGAVTCVTVHPIFSVVASASEDATIKIWDFETGDFERTMKGHTNTVQSLSFDKSGKMLASCSADLSIKLWDFSGDRNYECLRTLRGHDHNISSICFLPSGDRLISCSRDQSIRYWEVSTGFCVKTINSGHTDWIRCVAINCDGSLFASCGNDHDIIIWNTDSGQESCRLRDHTHVVETISFPIGPIKKIGDTAIENDSILASGSRDKKVKLWNASTGQCLMTFSDHENWVRCVMFHPNGQFLLSSSDDRSIRVYDLVKGRCMRTIADAHNHFVPTIIMHPAYPIVISGSVDKTLRVWECH